MKNIKFRFYDNKRKLMVYQFNNSRVDLNLSSYEKTSKASFPNQFIGKRDKNGKDIYEKDIVKIHQFLFDGEEIEDEIICIIGYDEESCCFCGDKVLNENISIYTGIKNGTDSIPLCSIYGLHEESFEVLGNIYEDKHLLSYLYKEIK